MIAGGLAIPNTPPGAHQPPEARITPVLTPSSLAQPGFRRQNLVLGATPPTSEAIFGWMPGFLEVGTYFFGFFGKI